jgi:hypothetical protein
MPFQGLAWLYMYGVDFGGTLRFAGLAHAPDVNVLYNKANNNEQRGEWPTRSCKVGSMFKCCQFDVGTGIWHQAPCHVCRHKPGGPNVSTTSRLTVLACERCNIWLKI